MPGLKIRARQVRQRGSDQRVHALGQPVLILGFIRIDVRRLHWDRMRGGGAGLGRRVWCRVRQGGSVGIGVGFSAGSRNGLCSGGCACVWTVQGLLSWQSWSCHRHESSRDFIQPLFIVGFVMAVARCCLRNVGIFRWLSCGALPNGRLLRSWKLSSWQRWGR